MKKNRFDLKIENYLVSKINQDEIDRIVNKRKIRTPKYKPFTYNYLQSNVLYPLINSGYIDSFVNLKCKNTWEIITACKIKNVTNDVFVLIHTSCELSTWVTREYASDAIHIGIVLNRNGNSYYSKLDYVGCNSKHYRTKNTFNNILKTIKENIDSLKMITPETFIKNSIKFTEPFIVDWYYAEIQRKLYSFKRRNLPMDRIELIFNKEMYTKNKHIKINKITFRHRNLIYNDYGCIIVGNSDELHFDFKDILAIRKYLN